MSISKEVKTGAIALAGIIVLYFGINYLKGKDFFSSQTTVYSVYERVDGLAPSNIIQINGLKAGFVHEIKLLPDHSGKILVTMHLQSSLKIPANSTAEIYSTDILGTKGIRIVFGDSKADVKDGDTLKADIQKSLTDELSAQVGPVKVKVENLISSLDTVTKILREVFNEQTKQHLRNTFESISYSANSIERISHNMDVMLDKDNGKIKSIIDNIQSITQSLKNISDTLEHGNIAGIMERASKTFGQAADLFEKMNSNTGSLGKLMNDDSLYTNLNSVARDMDVLAKDLKTNPKRYVHFSVFGKK
jgi:phospholipid/cholesterol/gamma-HCH transport system substrate-binding protein